MPYDKEGVQALVCAIEDLRTSNIIFSDKKLRQVLRCLSYYEEFRTVLSYCFKGFDYDSEKRKSLVKIGDSDIFRLPKSPKTLVALISQMLVEFDAGQMDFLSFTTVFFPAETKQESLDSFCVKVLEPYKHAIVNFVVEGVEEDAPAISRSVDFAPSGLMQHVEYLVVNLAKAIKAANIDEDLREELNVMLEGFTASLDARDSLLIKAVWLGLRRALADENLCIQDIEKVDEALRLYLISK